MAAKYWLKLYYEIIDDYKMAQLSRSCRYRVIELFCLAGENDEDGFLPDINNMVWRLRDSAEQIQSDLQELQKVGIVEMIDGRWFVTNFYKRQQAMSPAEKMRRQRNEKRNMGGLHSGDADVTIGVTTGNTDKDKDKDKDGNATSTTPNLIPYPETAKQAYVHPEIVVYKSVSGYFPGQDNWRAVIDAIRYIKKQHPNDEDLHSYLLPFWLSWDTRKTKDGKPFGKTNPTWLTEWAINNDIPPVAFSQNGNTPQKLNPRSILQGMTPA